MEHRDIGTGVAAWDIGAGCGNMGHLRHWVRFGCVRHWGVECPMMGHIDIGTGVAAWDIGALGQSVALWDIEALGQGVATLDTKTLGQVWQNGTLGHLW
eukprot:1161446-Pelagomonas_calceolata.AAC.4